MIDPARHGACYLEMGVVQTDAHSRKTPPSTMKESSPARGVPDAVNAETTEKTAPFMSVNCSMPMEEAPIRPDAIVGAKALRTAIDVGCEQVQELLEQLTVRDAPPTNDNLNGRLGDMPLAPQSNRSSSSNPSPLSDSSRSPTNSVPSLSEIGGTASFDTETSTSVAPFFHDHIQQKGGVINDPAVNYVRHYQQHAGETNKARIGHTALSALCGWTLEQVQGLPRTPIPLEVNTSTSTLKSPSMGSPKFGKKSKRKFGLPWTKKRQTAVIPALPSSRPTRLQMFGSEYARHLSKCSLAPATTKSKAAGSSCAARKYRKSSVRAVNLEDADPSVLTGALLDVCVTIFDESPPKGYYRVSQSASGRAFVLNRGMHLNVKKEAHWDKAAQRPCVTALAVIFPDRAEFCPPGFCMVRQYRKGTEGAPANLNEGGSERVFLCFRRSREGNPLTGLLPLLPDQAENIPEGYTVVEQTPRHFSAKLHGDDGKSVFLAYRQRLANLEALRPLPLILSVQIENEGGSCSHKLAAYYATGGTSVTSQVGRFHLLDRSTHSLLSPSSIANRLQLIEHSRARANGADYSGPTCENRTGYIRSDDIDSSSVGDASCLSRVDSDLQRVESNAMQFVASSAIGMKVLASTGSLGLLHDMEDAAFQSTLKAVNFIPTVHVGCPDEGAIKRLSGRSSILVVLLTACYTRHGGSALLAVESLASLLNETDFFADDVTLEGNQTDFDSATRLTLLDLAVQVVCDVATTGAQETTFGSCVDFVQKAVSFAQGQLNTRTIGYVLRFYLFVFYFGASVPTASSRWPTCLKPKSSSNLDELAFEDDEQMILYDPRGENGGIDYLPGGAPQAAAIAFKELVSSAILRLGKASVDYLVDEAIIVDEAVSEDNKASAHPYQSFLDDIIGSLVDKSAHHVERANYTQLALHQVHRSGGSELFWHDMVYACGPGLFEVDTAGHDSYRIVFGVFTNVVKVASGKLRADALTQDLMPKDIASKLFSLEIMLHFLEQWSDEQEASGRGESNDASTKAVDTLAFAIRRLVVPCLLWNTKAALENPRVFRRVVRIVSELWCSPVYRSKCRVELGVLIEHFGLRLLQLGPQLQGCTHFNMTTNKGSLLSQQVELLREVKVWFATDPKDVIELYLNYDSNGSTQITGPVLLLSGTQLKLFQGLCAAVSGMAEQCGDVIAKQIRENQSMVSQSQLPVSGLGNAVHTSAEEKKMIRESASLLRKTSLEAMSQIVKSLAVSAASTVGRDFATLLLSWSGSNVPLTYEEVYVSLKPLESLDETSINGGKRRIAEGGDEVLRFWQNAIASDHGRRLVDSRPSSQESLETALDIARGKSLKKAIEYLIASSALTPAPRDIANYLLIHKEQLDPSELGVYLGESGISGEESEYWNSIRLAFIRSISFVGMNVQQALRHLLTTCGFHLPGEAQKIDRIMKTFAQCFFEDNAGDTKLCPFSDEDSIYLLAFAIIMLNTDLHKSSAGPPSKARRMTRAEFITNFKGAEHGAGISRDYLTQIYDSIDAHPIVVDYATAQHSCSEDRLHSLVDMLGNVRSADSMLRGLSVHDFHFTSIDDFTEKFGCAGQDALSHLTTSCVSKTWHQWYGVVNTCLETAHLDPHGVLPSVEILLYSLAVTICLDMSTERSAFLSQLGRLMAVEEKRQGHWLSTPESDYREEKWYKDLEQACTGSNPKKLSALKRIHCLIESLHSTLSIDVQNKVEMSKAVAELEDGDFLLLDPARSFISSGDLVKKSSRNGRQVKYRFYLFSDVLLYANVEPGGRFKIHEELPLHLMKVIDWFPPTQRNRSITFSVHHPQKSFQVLCSSMEERKLWVQNIRCAITVEMEHKMNVEAARLAAFTTAS